MASETQLRVAVYALVIVVIGCGSSDSQPNTPQSGGTHAAGGGNSSGTSGSNATSGSAGTSAGGATNSTGGTGITGTPGVIGGCSIFTPDDAWNTPITNATVDEEWTTRLHAFVGDAEIHPDYGSDSAALYGIPINVVPEAQEKVPVIFDWYEDESDPGPYPFPSPGTAKIEGGNPSDCSGDCHLLTLQQGACKLYEGYACEHRSDGWHCGGGAVWDLTKNSYGQRPKGWTSADAAGLSITAGLLRYDEVRAGKVPHALRFTMRCTRNNFVRPATHAAVPDSCLPTDPNHPPMGIRVRLRQDFDVTGFPESAQVILAAMKTYGMILADNGSNFYFQGEAHPGWTEDEIEPLKDIAATEFEVVEVPPLEP